MMTSPHPFGKRELARAGGPRNPGVVLLDLLSRPAASLGSRSVDQMTDLAA